MMPIRRNNTQNWLPDVFSDFFDNEWMARTKSTAPAINVTESDDDYKVEVAAPGMTKEDFNIHLTEDGQLVIAMEKKSEKKEENERKYLRREFSYSRFQQAFILPEDIQTENISASVKDGVLDIILPKKQHKPEDKQPKRIEIR